MKAEKGDRGDMDWDEISKQLGEFGKSATTCSCAAIVLAIIIFLAWVLLG